MNRRPLFTMQDTPAETSNRREHAMNPLAPAERRHLHDAHGTADHLLRAFNRLTKQVANPFTTDDNGDFVYRESANRSFALELNLPKGMPGHFIGVSFYAIEGHPDMMRIRTSNWAAEYEPNGLYAIEDARRLYAQLRRAGMTPKA